MAASSIPVSRAANPAAARPRSRPRLGEVGLAVAATGAALLALLGGRALGELAAAGVAAGAVGLGALAAAPRRDPSCSAQTLAGRLSPNVDQVMIGAAETSYFVAGVARQIERDGAELDTLRDRADELAATTATVATGADEAARLAAEVSRAGTASRDEINRSRQAISDAQHEGAEVTVAMAALADRTHAVHAIIRTIETLASQTNLLALNASIEAALAGRHGVGFAVVASEIRGLAQATRAATVEIAARLREIKDGVTSATSSIEGLTQQVAAASTGAAHVGELLGEIATAAERSGERSRGLAEAADALARGTHDVSSAIRELRASGERTERELPRARDSATRVCELGEALQDQVAEQHIGGRHAEIRAEAERAAVAVVALFEGALARGALTLDALFDRRHVPIPRTAPTKYHTQFDDFTDQALPAIQEPILARDPAIAYAIVTDDHGYVPTHNDRFNAAPTGDPAVDLARSRGKRIFDDRTGRRCGQNQRPYLLQTYQRDTGEVMHDLSVPIVVAGRHWGGFRIGYRSAGREG
ncbi:MAG: methyl-accepting chemotaxis protein [Myxococcales bacterium]|nr:methyl-accepting chemotaxis protein [Myxococcales bacterium]MBP6845851.1 hypothetical protein [Kofleriaceae bacterium]